MVPLLSSVRTASRGDNHDDDDDHYRDDYHYYDDDEHNDDDNGPVVVTVRAASQDKTLAKNHQYVDYGDDNEARLSLNYLLVIILMTLVF